MEFTEYLPMLLSIVGGLVIVVNIVVEVLKKFTEPYISTNFVAVALSLVLTLAAFFAWASIEAIVIQWYYIAAAVVVGFIYKNNKKFVAEYELKKVG